MSPSLSEILVAWARRAPLLEKLCDVPGADPGQPWFQAHKTPEGLWWYLVALRGGVPAATPIDAAAALDPETVQALGLPQSAVYGERWYPVMEGPNRGALKDDCGAWYKSPAATPGVYLGPPQPGGHVPATEVRILTDGPAVRSFSLR